MSEILYMPGVLMVSQSVIAVPTVDMMDLLFIKHCRFNLPTHIHSGYSIYSIGRNCYGCYMIALIVNIAKNMRF